MSFFLVTALATKLGAYIYNANNDNSADIDPNPITTYLTRVPSTVYNSIVSMYMFANFTTTAFNNFKAARTGARNGYPNLTISQNNDHHLALSGIKGVTEFIKYATPSIGSITADPFSGVGGTVSTLASVVGGLGSLGANTINIGIQYSNCRDLKKLMPDLSAEEKKEIAKKKKEADSYLVTKLAAYGVGGVGGIAVYYCK